MSKERIQQLINAGVTILLIVISLFGYNVTILNPGLHIITEQSQAAQAAIVANTAAIADLSKYAMLAGATTHHASLATTSEIVAGTYAQSTTYLKAGTFVRGAIALSQTLTLATNITPTGTYMPIFAAANMSPAGIVAGTAGDLLILTNISNTTIVITDTGTVMLSANASLGQYDTLTLFSDGTNWLQLSTANN